MKSRAYLAAGCLLIASWSALAQVTTTQVIHIPSNRHNIYGCNLDWSPSQTGLSSVISVQSAPTGTMFYFWSGSQYYLAYLMSNKAGGLFWGNGGYAMGRGRAYLNRGGRYDVDVVITGIVPTSVETRVSITTAWAYLAYPYPVAFSWTGSSLAVSSPIGSKVHVMDYTNQRYKSYWKTRSGWLPREDFVIQEGQGFLFESTASMEWVVSNPFTWP